MNNTTNRKKSILLKTSVSMLIIAALAIFLILLLIRPTVYLSKESGFPKNEAVLYEKGKIRFVVPESVDIVNHTQIPIKMNWFTTNRLGSVISVQPKKGKALAIDFTNLKHDEIIFEITVKNLFGIKTKYDVIIDYSNYLRVFFEKNHLGQTRKPIVLPYHKMDHEFRHIKEELYKFESFFRFDKDGQKEKNPVSKSLVFSKNEAKGHAFLVNTINEIIVNYDFVLPGIFENNVQKTFILERIARSQKTLKTLNPKDKGLKLKFNQAPFYVTEFLGWFYYDETGNRVNVGIGEEITIPSWVKAEFKLTARYKYEISNQAGEDINKLGYVAISYFDGPERVYFATIKKGAPVENFKPNKPGYEFLGWYTDEALTQKYDFTPGNNIANKNMSLYLKSRRTSVVPHDHKITFITPAYANQLVPVYTMHGDRLDSNYSLPSMVTGYENGQFTELDYWTIVDPVSGKDTGKRFDFNTPITSDLTLKAHMRELKLPTPDREVKFRVIDSIDGKVVYEKTLTLKDNKIQDKDKAEINSVLSQKLAEKNHLLGKFTFRDWYLNADLNKKFNINDTFEAGITEINVFGLFNFTASNDIPDPNNPNNPKPLDPSLIKVTFLSDTTSVLSVQTNPKNQTFKGTLPEISKTGYRFKHWAYFKDGEIKGQFGLNDVLTENTTLYPVFEKDPNSPLPDTTVVATIVNRLLGTKEVRLVKKGELLDLNPQQYTTHLTPYLYDFSRFTNEDGTTFNYLTERIFSDKTIYVEHTKVAKDQVNYEIKHVFEGKEGEADRVETTTKQALVDSLVTVSPQDKLTGYDHGFELETTQSETKQVSSEFTTKFTLKYRRRRFNVNYETNFQNRFTGDITPSFSQTVKYEEKATRPANPSITKPDYAYTFVQWQLKSSMNGQYIKTQAYDFSQPVTDNVELVAYFTEKKTTTTYQIKHVIEGVDDIQEETRVVSRTAKAGSTFTVTSEDRLPEFDEHFTIDGLNQTKTINADGTTVFTLKYARKTYNVFYGVHVGWFLYSQFPGARLATNEPEPYKAKYQAKVKKPAYTPAIVKEGYSYRFIQWQDELKMNGTYQKIKGFDFENDRVSGNTYLLAYFVETVEKVNYTIKHVFEGVDDIAERIDSRTHQALTDTEVVVSRDQRLTEFDEHFTVEEQSQTHKIKGDGSTVFTLNYIRKSYTVTYEVNFNGTQFTDAMFGNEPQTQSIKYQGKITKPAVNPTLTRVGYSYTFVQWQEKAAMNGQYKPTAGFNFNDYRVEKDITLVAYFAETANAVNYTINHVIEGTDDGIAEQTITRTYTAIADSSHTVSRAQRLPEYEEHFTVAEQSQTQTIKPDGTTVFTLEYKRKFYTVTYEVNYNGNHFSGVKIENQPQSAQVKYQGKVQKPAVDPKLTKTGYNYTFVHWQNKAAMNGNYSQIQEYDFANARITGNTTLVAYFTENAKPVNYTINHVFEGVDDIAQRTDAKVHQALADSSVTVSRAQRLTEFDEHFTVADQTQTKKINADGTTVFTLEYKRKTYNVNFEVNFNGNYFKNATEINKPNTQTIKYQGKVNKPNQDPMIQALGLSFSFIHWQDKTKMNGNYFNVGAFNFGSERISKDTTITAFFKTIQTPVNYTIRHVIEGVDDIAEEVKTTTRQTFIGTTITVNRDYRLPFYDEGFETPGPFETKKITGDNTEVFTLHYKRKEFTVNFEANFNGNHFTDVEVIKEPIAIRAKYCSRIQTPETPVLKRHGRTYNFVQWQDKAKMNGNYAKISEFNFNTQRIQKDITLVAYFEEVIERVNYEVYHFLEKRGEDNSLNGEYDTVVETKYNQKVEDGATYTPLATLDTNLYEIDPYWEPKLRADLQTGDNSTVVYQHYRLKTIKVNFIKAEGVKTLEYEQKIVKKTREIETPGYSMEDTHHFIGWALTPNGPVQNKFIAEPNLDSLNIYAKTDYRKAKIRYYILMENANGSFTQGVEIDYARVGSTHTVAYTIPDTNIYERWEADKMSLVVSIHEHLNIVKITVFRKKFKVVFNVINSTAQINERTRRYGEQIGEINPNYFNQNDFLKFKLDGVEKTKQEVETHEVISNLTVEIKVFNDRKANYYPQTEVALSQSSIWQQADYPSLELKVEFNGEVLRTSYTRKVVFDKNEEQYEVIAGKYYKYEPIEFVQIPGNTGFFTKKIIDAIPFSLYEKDKDAQFSASIYTGQLRNIEYISKIKNLRTPTVSFSDNPLCLDNALRDPNLKPLLKKEPTDYAKAIFQQYTGISKFWRGIDFTALPHGYAQNDLSYLPVYEQSEMQSYWSSVIGKKNQNVGFLKPLYITPELTTQYSNSNIVRGIVLAKENM